jgi:hypothetical protein
MISPFDSLDEVNTQLAACKAALLDIMQGKTVRLNAGGTERIWTGEDVDKLQGYITYLSKERSKFLGKNRSATVQGRPAR